VIPTRYLHLLRRYGSHLALALLLSLSGGCFLFQKNPDKELNQRTERLFVELDRFDNQAELSPEVETIFRAYIPQTSRATVTLQQPNSLPDPLAREALRLKLTAALLQRIPELKKPALRRALIELFLKTEDLGPEWVLAKGLETDLFRNMFSIPQEEDLVALLPELPASRKLALLFFQVPKPTDKLEKACLEYLTRAYPGSPATMEDWRQWALSRDLPEVADYAREYAERLTKQEHSVLENQTSLADFWKRISDELLDYYKQNKKYDAIKMLIDSPLPEIAQPALLAFVAMPEIKDAEKTEKLHQMLTRDVVPLWPTALSLITPQLSDPKMRDQVRVIFEKSKTSDLPLLRTQATLALRLWPDAIHQGLLSSQLLELEAAMGKVVDEKKKAALREMLATTIEALGSFRNGDALQSLRQFLTGGDEVLAVKALEAIKQINLPDLNETLARLAEDTTQPVNKRSSAVSALYGIQANRHDPKSTSDGPSTLIRELFPRLLQKNPHQAIRLQVIVGMQELAYPSFKKPLAELLRGSSEKLEREYAFNALLKISPDEAIREIVRQPGTEDFYPRLIEFIGKDKGRYLTVLSDSYQAQKYPVFIRLLDETTLAPLREQEEFRDLSFRICQTVSFFGAQKREQAEERLPKLIQEICDAKNVETLLRLGDELYKVNAIQETLTAVKPILDNTINTYEDIYYVQAKILKFKCDIRNLPEGKSDVNDEKRAALINEIRIFSKLVPDKFRKEKEEAQRQLTALESPDKTLIKTLEKSEAAATVVVEEGTVP